MASEISSAAPTSQQLSAQSQFSTSDYGAVGDQRPYQIVQPAYPAPRWLARYSNLENALRECGTLCSLTGQPFRLVKWGARVPCYPCTRTKRTNVLPSLRIHSPGAIEGFASAQPVADFRPNAAPVVYDNNGQPKAVGDANFIVSDRPAAPSSNFINPQPLPQRYLQAVQTAQYMAATTGKTAFVCSSLGADCNGKGGGKVIPVVYVQPGGIVKRYREDLSLTNSVPGSQVSTRSVSEDVFRELVRESAGASRLGKGA